MLIDRLNFVWLACGVLLIVLLSGWCVPAVAGDSGYGQKAEALQARKMRSSEGNRSLDEVVDRVRMETNGQILSAEESDSEYRIRVLTGEGKVRRLRIDPASGSVIRPQR